MNLYYYCQCAYVSICGVKWSTKQINGWMDGVQINFRKLKYFIHVIIGFNNIRYSYSNSNAR
jgi:hypothetical protein